CSDRPGVRAVCPVSNNRREKAGRLIVFIGVPSGMVVGQRQKYLFPVRANGVAPKPSRRAVESKGEWIAKAARPNVIVVRPAAVHEWIIARHCADTGGPADLRRERGQVRVYSYAAAIVSDRPIK